MKTRYEIRELYLDRDGLMLYGSEDGGAAFYIILPKRLIRRFFVLLLRALR